METNETMNEELVAVDDSGEELVEVCSGNSFNIAAGLALGTFIGVVGTLLFDRVGKPEVKKMKARRAARKGAVVDAEFEEVKEEEPEEE